MRRLTVLLLFVTLVMAAVLFRLQSDVFRRPPRLVLLYATCTVNKNYLAPYSEGIRYTPNIAQFAAQSIVFMNHQTESGSSGGAYAGLFTGTHIFRHGIYYHPARLADDRYLIAEAFRENGYETFFWNVHDMASSELNYSQGVAPGNVIRKPYADAKMLTLKDDRLMSILRRLKSDKNYKAYIQVNFSLTHGPYVNSSSVQKTVAFCREFPEECKGVKENDLIRYNELDKTNHAQLSTNFQKTIRPLGLESDEVEKLIRVLEVTYKSSIHLLDRAFGETLKAINDQGLFDESNIVFTADHGEVLYRENAPIQWGHSFAEPEVLSIPLIIRIPKLSRAPVIYSKVTRSIDVFPTIAAFSGITLSSNHPVDGMNLSTVISGPQTPPDLIAFSCSPMNHPSIGPANPENIVAQARVLDTSYSLTSDSRIAAVEYATGKPVPFDLSTKTNSLIAEKLRSYRKRLIRAYRPAKEESNWDEVRENLKSLGYVN